MGFKSNVAKGFTWVNNVALAALGAYSFILSFQYFKDPTHCVLTGYMCLFGILGILIEVQVVAATSNFHFLVGEKGKAFFFLFVGTLGLSFGPDTTPTQLIIPFLLGIFSCVSAAVLFIDSCSSPPAEGGNVMRAGYPPPGQGPHAI